MSDKLVVRPAKPEDIGALTSIYNDAIQAGFQTADLSVFTAEERLLWLSEHPFPAYPVFVADDNGKVIGYSSVSPYRKGRMALQRTVEISYYVHRDNLLRGVGSALLDFTIKHCVQQEYKVAIAIVLDKNLPSRNLLKKFGFQLKGELPEVADFNGVICGHAYYYKLL